ncbi:TetR/AcrR family transcriptional regulator [Amycolatopsis sp. lyj-90]|uniref:TetR/AcrR family transcriptional regulator n=1 Tax=Amycolatopsis sp. lyj-90 TaxID=2789285 RepID=UPI00397937D3
MGSKLWDQSVSDHRKAVVEATLDSTAALVAQHGLSAITMSLIAKETGIGRATLYRHFPDVNAILTAWHAREMARNLEQMAAAGRGAGAADKRLAAVLEKYATISFEHHRTELAALLHQGEHAVRASKELTDFLSDLIAEGAGSGSLRDDVPSGELALFCVHSLAAAGVLKSAAAVRRLVRVTLAGLRSPC